MSDNWPWTQVEQQRTFVRMLYWLIWFWYMPSKFYNGHFHKFRVIAFVLRITPRFLYASISSTHRIKMSTNWHLLWKVVAASSILLYLARKLYTGKTAKQVLLIDNLILLLKPNSILSLVSRHAFKRKSRANYLSYTCEFADCTWAMVDRHKSTNNYSSSFFANCLDCV